MMWYAVLFAASLIVLGGLIGAVVALVQDRRAERPADEARWGDVAVPPCWNHVDELVGGPLTDEQNAQRADAVRQLDQIARNR